MSSTPKDLSLLKGLAGNEKQAVETIYRENYSLIQHLVIHNNGTEDDARDIFQEGLVVLYEKARTDSFELHCQLKTYLYSVCRRLWLKKLQQVRRYDAQIDFLEETVPVEDDLEDHEKRNEQYELMKNAIAKIGEPCKSLLEAFYVHDKSMVDIAGYFGYTNADNAKNQKYKCLMRLKKLFFAQYKNGN